jgi:DtxR family Mn-dependent transcriptional regulator
MSEQVEHLVYEKLGRPARSPYGNPIPGLDKFELTGASEPGGRKLDGADAEHNLASPGLDGVVVVSRICESVQTDIEVLRQLHAAGVDPGATVSVRQDGHEVVVENAEKRVRLPRDLASRVFVAKS